MGAAFSLSCDTPSLYCPPSTSYAIRKYPQAKDAIAIIILCCYRGVDLQDM